jgi:hypothetical protein
MYRDVACQVTKCRGQEILVFTYVDFCIVGISAVAGHVTLSVSVLLCLVNVLVY